MYPTDLTDSQYEVIKAFVEDNRKRKYSLKSIISAIVTCLEQGHNKGFYLKNVLNSLLYTTNSISE